MPMTHKVVQGECLSSIAKLYGFSSWKEIYDDHCNESLRLKRGNPNLLAPGDLVNIPDRLASFSELKTNTRYKFVLFAPIVKLVLRVLVRGCANFEFSAGDTLVQGPVPEGGMISFSISADCTFGRLVVRENDFDRIYHLKIGSLDPICELSGVRARLNNIGIYCGRDDDEYGEDFYEAIVFFQQKYKLRVTGIIDDLTKETLLREHGG